MLCASAVRVLCVCCARVSCLYYPLVLSVCATVKKRARTGYINKVLYAIGLEFVLVGHTVISVFRMLERELLSTV